MQKPSKFEMPVIKKPDVYIGIDGGQNIGIAIWSTNGKKFISLTTSGFWDAISVIDEVKTDTEKQYVFVVEDIEANRPTFRRHVNDKTIRKISQNVGMSKAYTRLIVEYLRLKECNVIMKRPGKKSFTKLTQEQFERMTGCKIKCSQHARDSAMLVFGL